MAKEVMDGEGPDGEVGVVQSIHQLINVYAPKSFKWAMSSANNQHYK